MSADDRSTWGDEPRNETAPTDAGSATQGHEDRSQTIGPDAFGGKAAKFLDRLRQIGDSDLDPTPNVLAVDPSEFCFDDALSFTRALIECFGSVQVVLIHPEDKCMHGTPTPAKLFGPDATDDEIREWLAYNRKGWGVYWSVNLTRHTSQKGAKDDVTHIVMAHVDADGDRAVNAQRVSELGMSFFIDSGGGFWGFRVLPEPIQITPDSPPYKKEGPDGEWLDGDFVRFGGHERPFDPELRGRAIREIEARNRHLKNLFDGGDSAQNVDRISRMPGTINWPNAKKKAAGRGPSVSRVVVPDGAPRLFALDDTPATYDDAAPSKNGKPVAASPVAGELKQVDVDLEPFREKLQPAVPFLIEDGCEVDVLKDILQRGLLGDDPRHKIHKWIAANSRHEPQHFATIEMLRAGMSADQVFSVLIDDGYGISRAIKTKDGKPRPQWKRYAKKRVADAWAEIEQPDDEFHINEQGKPLPSPHNFRLAVKQLGGELRYNEFSGKQEIHGIERHGPIMQDRTLEYLAIQIEERFGIKCEMARLKVILNEAADRNTYNPVLDYFESLKWDGVPRLDRWLIEYAGAEDDKQGYVRAVSPLPLLAAVKRQYEPGAKFDELLTLCSPQGFNKSSALRDLAIREEWFCEDLQLSSDPKVIIEQTRGKLLVEIAELRGQRGRPEEVKSMLSKQKDQARGAWGRYTEEVMRRWVAMGTTNDRGYLDDATGNRRHWPVDVAEFDLERLRADRDQLWAEAVRRVKAGESIRLDRKYWNVAKEQQEARRAECSIRDRLETILDGYEDHFVETAALWQALGVKSATDQGRSSKRLADAMTVLGWEKPTTRPVINGKRRSGWRKGSGSRLLGIGSLSEQIAEVDEETAA